ncbi:hypothetical protein V6N13_014413 [Hibiscus sabdariffa]
MRKGGEIFTMLKNHRALVTILSISSLLSCHNLHYAGKTTGHLPKNNSPLSFMLCVIGLQSTSFALSFNHNIVYIHSHWNEKKYRVHVVDEMDEPLIVNLDHIRRLVYDEFAFSFSDAVGRSGGLLSIWDKSNIRSGLDRFLDDEKWLLKLGDLVQEGLPRTVSDHVQKKGCRDVVRNVFSGDQRIITNLPMKLKSLKTALKRWNLTSCENFDVKVEEMGDKINKLEELGNGGSLYMEKQRYRVKPKGFSVEESSLRIDVAFIQESKEVFLSDMKLVNYGMFSNSDTQRTRGIVSRPIDNDGADYTELTAVKIALEVLMESKWTSKDILMMESDSQVVLNGMSNPLSTPWNSMTYSLAKQGCLRSKLFKAW